MIRRALIVMLCISSASVALADVRTEARRHFRRGMQLIGDGDTEAGVAELVLAYETLPHPNVLYNIARAYAEAESYPEAIDYFEQYLEFDPPDREEVEGFIAALNQRMAPQEPQAQVEPRAESEAEPLPVAGATEEEVDALESSADEIEQLANAAQSESLRERARRLRSVAERLRASHLPEGTRAVAAEPQPAPQVAEAAEDELLELGLSRQEDVYGETVVSASRFAQSPLDAPSSTAIITRQDIRLTGITHIGELIRRVAGADVMRLTPSDTSVSFRGFNQRLSPRTLVLVDGRSVYIDPLGATIWSTLPFNVEDIERIEVIRGPASALYGADAFSGIVNIITRAPGQETSVDAVIAGGNARGAHAHVAASGRTGRLGYRVALGYNHADRFSREISSSRVDFVPTFDDRNVGVDAFHANLGARYRVSPEVELYLQGGYNQSEQNMQGTGPLRDFLTKGPTSHIMAGATTSWGSLRAFWNRVAADAGFPEAPLGGEALESEFEWNTYDIEGELAREFHLGVDHNLHLGAAYRRKQIDWTYLNGEQTENHFAIFFQETARIIEQLSLVGSFRLDFHPLLDAPVFSPRGAVILKPAEGSAIRASAGTAFRTQTFLESYLDLRNPTPVDGVNVRGLGSEPGSQLIDGFQRLTPERIVSAELGYRNEQSSYFDVDVSAYYNRVSDLVILTQLAPYRLNDFGQGLDGYDPDSESFGVGAIGFQNDPTTYDVVGGELSARTYPINGLDVYGNYAFNRAFVRDAEPGQTEERTSRHKVTFGAQYRAPFGLELGVDFHWVSPQVWREQTFDAEEGVRFVELDLPAYHLINGRIGMRLLDDRLTASIAVYNLTHQRIRQHPYGQKMGLRGLISIAYHH